MQQLASSLGIQLDVAYSIQEAKQAITEDSSYKAFIIDGHLPDGHGFELVAWIREKKALTLPIGFISRIYQDAASFRILKQSFKVDYVLEKPIKAEEVHQLFMQICHLTDKQTAQQESFPDEILADLKVNYQQTILDKVERLEKMILNVQKDPSIENLQTLRGEVHKIAGSAGSYGYLVVSDLCKNLELDLIKQMDLAKQGQLNDAWLASLDEFFTQIKIHFQMQFLEKESQASLKSGVLSSVFIVDENQDFLDDFTQSVQHLAFQVLTESHPENAIQTLLTADFYPQILFITAHHHSTSLTGFEMIRLFYQKNDELTNTIALMVKTQALDDQVEAFRKGMSIVLTKPFLPSLLLPLLDQIPFRALPLQHKILIIDDDLDICQYILKALKYTGIEIQALNGFFDLEQTLKSYQPDLVLLDLNLIDESSIGIFHRLRNEWGYDKLLVGMLALTQQDMHLLQQSYKANIDDIIFKPLELGVLQRKIAFLLKEQAHEMFFAKGDFKQKIATSQILKRYLNALQLQYGKAIPKMLVMFEIGKLAELDPKIKKEAIEYLFLAFEELLNKYEIAANLGYERFAFVFQGYDPHFVQLFMHDFLLRLHTHLKDHFIREFFHIHEALVLLSEEESASDILKRGEELLNASQKQSQESVRLMTDSTFQSCREVFIFSDSMHSLDFLQSLFEENDFKVTLFSNYQEFPQSRISLPLFILTGSFSETEELQLLKNLITHNQVQIPILHLPHVPEPEYLKHFLNGINYFKAPFGLIILIAKS